jgi:hypothetical protein
MFNLIRGRDSHDGLCDGVGPAGSFADPFQGSHPLHFGRLETIIVFIQRKKFITGPQI